MHLENVLSLFDGISCGQVALERAGHTVGTYIASEIDRFAMTVSKNNFPSVKQVGDVKNIKITGARHYNLLMGGSPCQGFSNSGGGMNFSHPGSKLFFEFIRIKNDLMKRGLLDYFLLENVSMRREWRDTITKFIEVEPIEINSSLLSAQNRKRLYWTNIQGINQPNDKGLLLRDVLENNVASNWLLSDAMSRRVNIRYDDQKASCLTGGAHSGGLHSQSDGIPVRKKGDLWVYLTPEQIEIALTRYSGKTWKRSGKKTGSMKFSDGADRKAKCLTREHSAGNRCVHHIQDELGIRRLTPIEWERLQTLPDNYTAGVSNTQRYKALGNGWTVDVISHILSFMK